MNTNNNSNDIEYPSWELAEVIIKFLRNTVPVLGSNSELAVQSLSLELKILRTFQNDLANRMKPYGKVLEDRYNRLMNIGR